MAGRVAGPLPSLGAGVSPGPGSGEETQTFPREEAFGPTPIYPHGTPSAPPTEPPAPCPPDPGVAHQDCWLFDSVALPGGLEVALLPAGAPAGSQAGVSRFKGGFLEDSCLRPSWEVGHPF